MSNTCGWSSGDPNTQQILDVICTAMETWCEGTDWHIGANATVFDVAEQTSLQADAIGANLSGVSGNVLTTKNAVTDATHGNAALQSLLTTINAALAVVEGHVVDIGTAFTASGGGAVYPTPNAHNIAEDFVNTRTAVAVINTVNTLLSARLGAGGAALGNLLQNAAAQFLSNSGVQVNLNANLALAAGGMVPPITSLTVQAFAPIVNQRVDSIPAGAYGCRIDLTVPSTWGQIDNWPFYYVPPVARLDYARSGYYGFNPIGIQTDFILAYPFPPWADSMVVSLGVGVTAERAWLVL